jgi:hypothetical protein
MTDSLPDALTAARRLFDALYRAEWEYAATMISSESAEAFRNHQIASLVVWAHHRGEMQRAREAGATMTAWTSDGTINEAWLAEQASTPLARIPRVRTLGALADLSAADFLALHLEVSNPKRGAAEGGPTDRNLRRIVGGVLESPDVAHILYRPQGPGYVPADPYDVKIGRLRRTEDVWLYEVSTIGQDVIDGSWFMMLADDDYGHGGRADNR